MKIVIYSACFLLAILPSTTYLYAGTPHLVDGNLFNSDHSIPSNSDVHFTASIQSRPGEVLTQIDGCLYESGAWQVDVGNFATSWIAGDVLKVDFTNTLTSATGTLTYTLTITDPEDAPNFYFPPPWTPPAPTDSWETVWGYITGFNTLVAGDQIAAFRGDTNAIVGLTTISSDSTSFAYNMIVYSPNTTPYEVRFTVWDDGSGEIPATPNFTTNPVHLGGGPTQHNLEKSTSATATPTATIPSVDTPTPTPTATSPSVDTPTPTPTATSPSVNTPTPTPTATSPAIQTPTPTPTATTGAAQIPTSTPTGTSPAGDTPTPTPTPVPPLALQVSSELLKTGDFLSIVLSLTQNISEHFDLYILAEASYGITYSISLSGNISQGIKAAALNVPSATAPLSATILNNLPISPGLSGKFKFYAIAVQAKTIPPVSSPDELTPQTVHVLMLDTVTVTIQ